MYSYREWAQRYNDRRRFGVRNEGYARDISLSPDYNPTYDDGNFERWHIDNAITAALAAKGSRMNADVKKQVDKVVPGLWKHSEVEGVFRKYRWKEIQIAMNKHMVNKKVDAFEHYIKKASGGYFKPKYDFKEIYTILNSVGLDMSTAHQIYASLIKRRINVASRRRKEREREDDFPLGAKNAFWMKTRGRLPPSYLDDPMRF